MQTVSVAAREPRRLRGTVPTWRTTPGPGAVKVVTMLVPVVVDRVVSGRGLAADIAVGVVVVVVVVESLAGAVGVTAVEAVDAAPAAL